MFKMLAKSLWLLFFSVVICCVIYPLVMLAIGQTLFPFQANGSIVEGPDGKPVGSLLIAQPFTKDEYFQPRPSAIGTPYDATSSTSSALAASNYALRYRVAQALGPIATYKSGDKKGQNVAPDIEAWFQKDKFQGEPGIVAKWADYRSNPNFNAGQNWVGSTFDPKSPTPPQQYVLDWEKKHAADVAQFKKDNPDNSDPSPSDLASVFFKSFSKENPGKFPSSVTHTSPNGKTTTTAIEPVKEGSDIQANFFDMWLTENPKVELNDVPGDMLTTSGSGLDPHITLDNAMFQLDRVAGAWAKDTKGDAAKIHADIEKLLKDKSSAPLGGAFGEPMVNVLEVNLELTKKYGKPS